jgi:hypothetical protein
MTSTERSRRRRARLAPATKSAPDKLKQLTLENMSLRQQLRDALARMPKTQRVKQPAKEPRPVDEEIKRLRKLLAEARARLQRVAESNRGTVFMTSASRRKILAALHPDHQSDPVLKRRQEEAFQIFSAFGDRRDLSSTPEGKKGKR